MAFRNLLEAPQADAQTIMDNRFPVPRYIVCDQHKSEARFLMAKLNPSSTHNSDGGGGAQVFTDDVSLRVFMEHCKYHRSHVFECRAQQLLSVSDSSLDSFAVIKLSVQS